jgi:galactose oxidase
MHAFSLLLLVSTLHLTSAAVTITTDSYNLDPQQPPQWAIDGNPNTFWHTAWVPSNSALPHHVNIDLGVSTVIDGFSYLPRQDGVSNGNIGQWTLQVSPDKITFTTVATGVFVDDPSIKEIGFPAIRTQHLLFTALTEAGNRGPWSSAAEFNWHVAPTTTNLGKWDPVIEFPLVPAGAFIEWQSGKVLTFSSYKVNTFVGTGITYTATFDPKTDTVSERIVTQTDHDMFCPGMSLESTGLTIVTGGDDASKLSIYNPVTDTWTAGAPMNIPRGYQASTSISDGRIFVIGGSWNGGRGGKNGEIYSPRLNTWTLLPGCPVAPMLTNDAGGIYRQDNHAWLFGWSNGFVFQAGPSKAMNWYGATGTGSQSSAGVRGNDPDAMNGNAVMYDVMNGKIFTCGGSPSYEQSQATTNAHIITIGAPNTVATVVQVASMKNARAFANSVILPNGKIMVTGGENFAVPFSDNTAVMTPELYDPAANTWTTLPAHTVPRNYHSVALLMLDGRVFTGGGGLCGECETNHEDAQVYNPSYLYTSTGALATRPVIKTAPTGVQIGTNFQIVMDSPCTSFSLIKFGSATHSVDTDQRRIAFTPIATAGNTYTFAMPGDAGKAMPGYWMFFALNSAGVPSVAATIRVTIAPP